MAKKSASKPKSAPKAAPAAGAGARTVAPPEPPLSVGVPATAGAETHGDVAIGDVHRCPFNARKHFDPDDIAGLGASIMADRLKEPLLVRPVAKIGDSPPVFDGKSWGSSCDHFQLADGERRLRALLWIAHAHPDKAHAYARVPVIVRPMTDEQVRAVMLLSREQSRDLSVSELVAGYTELRNGAKDDAAVANLVGKPVAYVRSVLRLAKLPPWARPALDTGGLSRATAELVARVPGEESRKKATACVLLGLIHPNDVTGTPDHPDLRGFDPEHVLSYRDTKALIANHFQVQLKGAPFSRKELYILPGCEPGHERHIQSCDECPKLAANDPEAVAEGTRGDVCLDPDCYREKVEAHDEKELMKAVSKGAERAADQHMWLGYGDGVVPRGFCDINQPASESELAEDFGRSNKKGSALAALLEIDRLALEDAPCTVFAALDNKRRLRLLVRTGEARKALQTKGVLKKPEPRAKGLDRLTKRVDEAVANGSTQRTGGKGQKPSGPSEFEIDEKASAIAAAVLRDYTTDQCDALDEHQDAHEDGPIRSALELALRCLCYDAFTQGYGIIFKWAKKRFAIGDVNDSKGRIDSAICAMRPSQMVGLLMELAATMELPEGPNRVTGKSLLEFAELDWDELRQQAKRELSGGEPAEAKIAAAESKPTAENLTDSATAAPAKGEPIATLGVSEKELEDALCCGKIPRYSDKPKVLPVVMLNDRPHIVTGAGWPAVGSGRPKDWTLRPLWSHEEFTKRHDSPELLNEKTYLNDIYLGAKVQVKTKGKGPAEVMYVGSKSEQRKLIEFADTKTEAKQAAKDDGSSPIAVIKNVPLSAVNSLKAQGIVTLAQLEAAVAKDKSPASHRQKLISAMGTIPGDTAGDAADAILDHLHPGRDRSTKPGALAAPEQTRTVEEVIAEGQIQTRLADIDDFPDAVADALAPRITTLPTLLERMHAECPATAELPLRNRLVQFLVAKAGVKLKPAERAADAIAQHAAKSGKAAAEIIIAKADAEPDAPKEEPISALGITEEQMKRADIVCAWGDGTKKIKKPVNVRPVEVDETLYVWPGALHHLGGSKWFCRALIPAADFATLHPNVKTLIVPLDIEENRKAGRGNDYYFGVRVLHKNTEYIIGPKETERVFVLPPTGPKKAAEPAPAAFYGWDITYTTHDHKELTCHYVGTEKAARRKAMLRPKAKEVVKCEGLTKEQWVACYGLGKM